MKSVRNKIQASEIRPSPYGEDGVGGSAGISVGVSVGRWRRNYLTFSASVGSVGAFLDLHLHPFSTGFVGCT